MKSRLPELSNEKLIDIVKHHRRYHYKKEIQQLSLDILKQRGVDNDQIAQFTSEREIMIGQLEGTLKEFKYFGRLTLIFYCVFLLLSYFIAGTNMITYMIIGGVSLAVYLIYYLLMYSRYYNFYKKLDGNAYGVIRQFAFFLAGFPLCFLAFYYSLREMRKELLDRY